MSSLKYSYLWRIGSDFAISKRSVGRSWSSWWKGGGGCGGAVMSGLFSTDTVYVSTAATDTTVIVVRSNEQRGLVRVKAESWELACTHRRAHWGRRRDGGGGNHRGTQTPLILHRLRSHSHQQTLLHATVLTPVSEGLVHYAMLVAAAYVVYVAPDGALEEALAALARDDTIMTTYKEVEGEITLASRRRTRTQGMRFAWRDQCVVA